MLTPFEKFLFVIAALASAYFTLRGLARIAKNISSGQGKINWSLLPKRIVRVIVKAGFFQNVFRFRLIPSVFHVLIAWSFLILALTDLTDPIYALTGVRILDHLGGVGRFYLFIADIANAAVLVGILFMVVRRFIVRPANLSTRETTLLHPKARFGIKRDSFIVAAFIIFCNTGRLGTVSSQVIMKRARIVKPSGISGCLFPIPGAGFPPDAHPRRRQKRVRSQAGTIRGRSTCANAGRLRSSR